MSERLRRAILEIEKEMKENAAAVDRLFKQANFCCQICGKIIKPGVKGLQADHKVPLIRRGSQTYENWQYQQI